MTPRRASRHAPRKRGYPAAASRLKPRSLEYSIARRSLSSGGHSADPVADDDSGEYDSAFSRHNAPEVCRLFSRPLEIRGRRECRMRAAPAISCANCRKLRTRAYRAAEAIRHSLRNGFTAYNVLSPVSRSSLATVVPEKLISPELDASVGASGPHDFAVRISIIRPRALCRSAITSRA